MSRIDPSRLAAILIDTSWMDRLDLSSPSLSDRERAAEMIAQAIVTRLESGGEATGVDTGQACLPLTM